MYLLRSNMLYKISSITQPDLYVCTYIYTYVNNNMNDEIKGKLETLLVGKTIDKFILDYVEVAHSSHSFINYLSAIKILYRMYSINSESQSQHNYLESIVDLITKYKIWSSKYITWKSLGDALEVWYIYT